MRAKSADFKDIYSDRQKNRERFRILTERFAESFADGSGEEHVSYYTSPGRTEIIGNHTDHNGGKILAGSIDLDTIGAARRNDLNKIRIESEGYGRIELDLGKIDEVTERKGTRALLAGIVEGFRQFGFQTGGFDACVSTTVIAAAGVSSSASYEMLICAILNNLYNGNQMDYPDYARIGQYAENHFWNKGSGQMDQMACACGGTILLDFSDLKQVVYSAADFSFGDFGYEIVIVNTGKGHADLSAVYSSIPDEMRQVSGYFGKERLADMDREELLSKLSEAEEAVKNDRAILRALHFFNENERVEKAVKAANEKQYGEVLSLLSRSGASSFELLQNCYVPQQTEEQKIPLALALSDLFINRTGKGICRVHGGGFAGVIMTVIPKENVPDYVEWMTPYFGRENIYPMNIRGVGAVRVDNIQ